MEIADDATNVVDAEPLTEGHEIINREELEQELADVIFLILLFFQI